MAASDFKIKIAQACQAGEEFQKIYYDSLDKRRNKLSKLYSADASLVWNGNACSGSQQITKFYEQLPTSDFRVDTLDCQPIAEEATNGVTSVLVTVSGTVKFEGNRMQGFNQTFVLAQTGDVWKVASDSFRFHE
ncbi:NTF2-related export protein 1-like [Saccoglossus kowalevskii]|uniref:NTF2-related export protein n=1 Tax=Saccoglossus kowalevskii TaxID=10224 RepID=A0ABM0GJZ4_SACKO|nr:PREDICTED: NTF2-related export protein 1-like [Saccoglossus kowalevskii]